jgi:hypothetical protein
MLEMIVRTRTDLAVAGMQALWQGGHQERLRAQGGGPKGRDFVVETVQGDLSRGASVGKISCTYCCFCGE